MLKNWYLSGLGALSGYTNKYIEGMSQEQFFGLFEENFEDLIGSWVMQGEIKEYDQENDIVISREAFDEYTALMVNIFSGVLANKWNIRELEDLDDIDGESEKLPSEVLYDDKRVYTKKGVAGEYLQERLTSWGESGGRKGTCALCDQQHKVVPVKQYLYPLTIVENKFQNLRPSGTENINVCRKCASVLFSAYSNTLFNLNNDYLNLIFMFSEDMDAFTLFKDKVMRNNFEVQYNTNLKGIENYAGVKRPYDFLFVTLSEFSKKPELAEDWEDIPFGEINFVLAGADVSGDKSIYSDVDRLDSSSKIWDLFEKWRETSEAAPRTFFHSMVPDLDNEDLIINRNRFLENLLIQKKPDYKSLEKATFASISEGKSVVKFSNTIISDFLEVYEKMEEKEVFERVSKKGYKFGMQISDRESNQNKSKGHLYQLRRSRDLGSFLDNINSIQTSLSLDFNQKVFLEHSDEFDKLKPIFLISLANAIFGGQNNND